MPSWEESKRKWLAALRSGDYEQGHEYLIHDGLYCCLGVLASVFAPNNDEALRRYGSTDDLIDVAYEDEEINPDLVLPESVYLNSPSEDFGMPEDKVPEIFQYVLSHNMLAADSDRLLVVCKVEDTQRALAHLNDQGYSFEQIAEVIEEVL